MKQTTHAAPVTLQAAGYDKLAKVLQRAFTQAAEGKGKERHASDGMAFQDQPMSAINNLLGSTDGFVYQATKKAVESRRLPRERAVAELLGAINYLAGAVIFLERGQEVQLQHDEPQGRCACKLLPAGACTHGAGCNDG